MRSNIQHYFHKFLIHFLLVVAYKRMEILKLSSKKVAAVAYERWSFARGYKSSYRVFEIRGPLWQVVDAYTRLPYMEV